MTQNDARLLKDFVERDSEAAFTQLVRRHIDFVYAAALRQVNGDSGLAADVSQAVFIDLAKKAKRLTATTVVAAWLYRATRLACLAALRARERQICREREAVRMQEIGNTSENSDWNAIQPTIDAALEKLKGGDREIILLRYFQKQTFCEIGEALRLSEDAARMRVERALERLRSILTKQGFTSTSTLLSSALTAQAASPTPSGLAMAVSQAAFTAVAQSSVPTIAFMATTKLKLGIAATLAVGGIAIATREHLAKAALQNEIASIRAETARITPAASPNLASEIDLNELSRLRAEHAELMQLRGEVVALRKAKQDAERTIAAAQKQQSSKPDEAVDPEEQAYNTVALARMNYANGWGTAILAFAKANGGRMPTSFEQAGSHFPERWASLMSAFDSERFEIVFRGSLNDIARPERTIIVREKEPFSNPKEAGFARTYLFADGHTELHRSADGNFEPWERDRMISGSAPTITGQ